MDSSAATGILSLTDVELLKKIHQRIVWHFKVIRYCPSVKDGINHLKELKKANDEKDLTVVFQGDIQHAITCGQARVVPGSAEQCTNEPAWQCTIQGPMKSGELLQVRIFLSDDESEPVRIDGFLKLE